MWSFVWSEHATCCIASLRTSKNKQKFVHFTDTYKKANICDTDKFVLASKEQWYDKSIKVWDEYCRIRGSDSRLC